MLQRNENGEVIAEASPVVNGAGIILFYFFFNGVKTAVYVDDYLPVKKDEPGKLLFSRTNTNSFWVSLLEKAWAKYHGRYFNTEERLPRYAFTHLSGAPSSKIWLDSYEQFMQQSWRQIMADDHKDFCFIAASESTQSET
jgi:hypothetical protein